MVGWRWNVLLLLWPTLVLRYVYSGGVAVNYSSAAAAVFSAAVCLLWWGGGKIFECFYC